MSLGYRSHPCAHFFTIGTYASHLHGDVRGAIMRSQGGVRIGYNPNLLKVMESELVSEPVSFNYFERAQILDAIIEWAFRERIVVDAVNVRTEHMHLLVFPLVPIERSEIVRRLKMYLSEIAPDIPGFRSFPRLWERKYHAITVTSFTTWYRMLRYTLDKQGSNYYFKFTEFAMRQGVQFTSKINSDGRVTLEPISASLLDAFGGTRMITFRRNVLTGPTNEKMEELS